MVRAAVYKTHVKLAVLGGIHQLLYRRVCRRRHDAPTAAAVQTRWAPPHHHALDVVRAVLEPLAAEVHAIFVLLQENGGQGRGVPVGVVHVVHPGPGAAVQRRNEIAVRAGVEHAQGVRVGDIDTLELQRNGVQGLHRLFVLASAERKLQAVQGHARHDLVRRRKLEQRVLLCRRLPRGLHGGVLAQKLPCFFHQPPVLLRHDLCCRSLWRRLHDAQLRGLVDARQRLAARTHVRPADLARRLRDVQHLMTHPALFRRSQHEGATATPGLSARHLTAVHMALRAHRLVKYSGHVDTPALHVHTQARVRVQELFIQQLLQLEVWRRNHPCSELGHFEQRSRRLGAALYVNLRGRAPIALAHVVHLLPADVLNAELHLAGLAPNWTRFRGVLQRHPRRRDLWR